MTLHRVQSPQPTTALSPSEVQMHMHINPGAEMSARHLPKTQRQFRCPRAVGMSAEPAGDSVPSQGHTEIKFCLPLLL